MKKLNTQIHFPSKLNSQLIIGLIVAVLIGFVVVSLEPLDTNNYSHPYKRYLLLGYSIIFMVYYAIHSRIERVFYLKANQYWSIKNEIISLFILMLLVSVLSRIYLSTVINDYSYSLKENIDNTLLLLTTFSPIVILPLLFLRRKFGELKTPEEIQQVHIQGINKEEQISLKRADILFAKASENYVDIFFLRNQELSSVTFRSTLASISSQAPFLVQCHRSYLFNLDHVLELIGNSQKATIVINHSEESIPISKSSFKKVKNLLSNHPKK